MIFEFIATLGLDKVKDAIARCAGDRLTFSSIKTQLRPTYESAISPANLDFVLELFFLSRDDITDLLSEAATLTPALLEELFRNRLAARTDLWIHNRPGEILLNALVTDLAKAYIRQLESSDPQFSVLLQNRYSAAIIKKLEQLVPDESTDGKDFLDHMLQLVASLELPIEILTRTPHSLELQILDTKATWTTKIFVAIHKTPLRTEEISLSRELGGRDSEIGLRFFVTEDSAMYPADLSRQLPGFRIMSARSFADAFLATPVHDVVRLYCGTLAAENLQAQLYVRDLFVPPDAVKLLPGENMELKYFSERQPAMEHIDSFLRSESKILVILGNYGSGKSALCSHLLTGIRDFGAVLVTLRTLRGADDIPATITRAHRLAQKVHGERPPVLVILDGIDEMHNAMDLGQRKYNVLQLLQSAHSTDKIIVTARSSYFRGLDDFWTLFQREGDSALWTKMSTLIAPGQRKVFISSIMLREFDTQAVAVYIAQARAQKRIPHDDQGILESLDRIDDLGQIRSLMRNPLYLHMIVELCPWKEKEVACLADLIESFIRFWLARDTEKGPSRWLLTQDDRRDFAERFAFYLFERGLKRTTFAEFESFARKYLSSSRDEESVRRIVLDLQTTGIFGCLGESIMFAVPVFGDLLVANRYSLWRATGRLPSLDQCKLLLGRYEAYDPFPESWQESEYNRKKHPFADTPETRATVARAGLTIGTGELVASGFIRSRYVFGLPADTWMLAGRKSYALFCQIVCGLQSKVPERNHHVILHVISRMGIHARPAALIVRHLAVLQKENAGSEFVFERDDEKVDATSIIGVMMLAAGRGTELILHYRGCALDRLELALQRMGAARVPEEIANTWVLHSDQSI